MKVCVLNGSPKGNFSVTLYTALYIEKKFPNSTFEILNVGQKIKYYEKNFDEVERSIKNADIILFSYPVYTFLAPSQLQRFISLLKIKSIENNIDFSDKFATQITTSKHFYDMTAHEYIKENCFDLGLKFISGLSADMDDLPTQKGQDEVIKFWNYVSHCVKNNIYEIPKFFNLDIPDYIQKFDNSEISGNLNQDNIEKSNKYKTIILTDTINSTNNLNSNNILNMIEDFKAIYPYDTKIINIAEYPFSGGCLGCLKCSSNGKCIYKDGFDEFLRNEIQSADAIIYAFEIKDHSMGYIFKCYDDRQFCNGHRSMTVGMPIGYLIFGNYKEENNLRIIIEARAEVGHNFLTGVSTNADEIKMMVSKLTYSLDNKYYLSQNFYGVGGRKIFRDLIYIMRGLMKADHKFYKETGVYDDLPQNDRGRMILMMFIGAIIENPKIKSQIGNKMNEAIIKPYKQVIDNIKN